MSKLTGVLVCVPAYGSQICMETAHSLYVLGQSLTANKIPNQLSWWSAADIAAVRNIFMTVWYDAHQNCSHLLYVDADMEFDPNLVRDMIAFDKPVVGCYYHKRNDNQGTVGNSLKQDTLADVVSGHLKVKATGAGVLLIRRDAITTMLEKMPEIALTNPKALTSNFWADVIKSHNGSRIIKAFDPIKDDDGDTLSEDMSFCRRWRDCGGEVWANVDHVIGHIGRFNYAIRYADYLETKARDEKAEAA